MKTIAIDTETELITATEPTPRLVCLSYSDGELSDLVGYRDAAAVLSMVEDSGANIVGHNFAFDASVLSAHDPDLQTMMFCLYEGGRVRDTLHREALARIARGTLDTEGPLSLDFLSSKYLGRTLDKGEDGWRLRYGELRETPLADWPERARAYPIADAATTHELYARQKDRPDEVLQARADFALRMMAVHGVVTDEAAVDAFELSLLETIVARRDALREAGILKPKKKREPDGEQSRDMKKIHALIEEALGEQTPRTPTGRVQADEDALEAAAPRHPVLATLAEYQHASKLLDTYVPVVRVGIDHPIHCSYRVLVASGRTSCSRPNWQNLPREAGARECVVPRKGKVFVAADYNVAELRALAQVCYSWFGYSALREAFLKDRDPHLELAATLLSISYDEAVARRKVHDPIVVEARQFAKIPNFGFPGGLGAEAFAIYARRYGHDVSPERARELKAAWAMQWPEMRQYFEMAGQVTGDLGEKRIEQYGSGRVRGGLSFTQAANTMFQGLVADCAKDATWEVTRRCYTVPTSKLYGARPIFFVHDELILEADEEQAADAAEELVEVMEEIEAKWLRDVPPAAEGKLMRRWSKKAEPVRRDGRLIPWEDR